MVKLAESELPVVLSHDRLDANPMLLGVQNGVIELGTGKFREGRREDYISKRCDVAYNKDATCPEWRKFQGTITGQDAELIAYKQRLAAVLLTGKVVEVLFIPWGCGSNGKSTELETYQAILGDYGHATDATLLLAQKNTSGPTPEVVALKGKRAIFINETPERARLNEARVKYLTGNDTLSGRGLHQEPINFLPTHKVVMRTNHKPIIRGTDLGIWRRIHLIPFTVTIAGADPDFRERNLVPELPGNSSRCGATVSLLRLPRPIRCRPVMTVFISGRAFSKCGPPASRPTRWRRLIATAWRRSLARPSRHHRPGSYPRFSDRRRRGAFALRPN
jgi:putative DNA primase/helicase